MGNSAGDTKTDRDKNAGIPSLLTREARVENSALVFLQGFYYTIEEDSPALQVPDTDRKDAHTARPLHKKLRFGREKHCRKKRPPGKEPRKDWSKQ